MNILFLSGNNHIHVVDFSNVANPRIIHNVKLSSIANDIEICTSDTYGITFVGVAMEAATPSQPGQVIIYESYTRANGLKELFKVPGEK